MTRAALAIALAVSACHTPNKPPPAPNNDKPACDATPALSAAMALSTDGYLHRALAVIDASEQTCTSPATLRARAELLADLGLSEAAIVAYHIYARASEEGEQVAADAIAELEKRPPSVRDATAEERATALALYRDGVDQRLQGDNDRAITQLRRSYSLLPHPLTIVQIGLAHEAAGREVEARRSNARAMAIAEEIAGTPPLPRIRGGHMARVRSIAFQPGGRLLASGSEDGTVMLWDSLSGREQRTLIGHNHHVLCTTFSADGVFVVSGAKDGQIIIWDAATGERVNTLDVGEVVYDIAFAPDGSRMVTLSRQHVTVWNARTWQSEREIDTGVGSVGAIAVDTTGTLAAIGGDEKHIEIWNIATGQRVRTLDGHEKRIDVLTFSPDGHRLASASPDRTIRMWAIDDGTEIDQVTPRSLPYRIAFNHDGTRYVLASGGNRVDVHDTASNEIVASIAGTHTVAVSDDGSRIATLTPTGMTVYDGVTFEPAALFERRPAVMSVAFSGDGTQFAMGGYDQRVTAWTADALQPVNHEAEIGVVSHLAFHGARDTLFAAGQRMLSVTRIAPAFGASRHAVADSEITGLAVSDRYVATAEGNIIKTREFTGHALAEPRTLEGHPVQIHALAFDQQGNALASADENGAILFWDVASGETFHSTRSHEGMRTNAIALASVEPLLVSGGHDNTVRVWNVKEAAGFALEGHEHFVNAVGFTKDDTYIVSASEDGTLRLWNYQERTEMRTLSAHSAAVSAMAVRHDDVVATASYDGTAKLWDVRRGDLLVTLSTTRDGRWVATAPDGRITGSEGLDGGVSLVYWQAGDIQLPGFVGWQRWHTPELITSLLSVEEH